MNTHTTSTSEPRQLRIDWTSATKRFLLSRLAKSLQGITLGDPDRPKQCMKGSTIDQVLQGLHGWCIKEGWTDRTPKEICPSLGEQTVRRVLAFLQSESAESSVSAENFRYRNSPRVRRSICWANVEAWCEQLEQAKAAHQEELKPEKHPLAPVGSPSRTEQVTLSQREGHPLAARGSYKEDGPENGPDGPPHGATCLLSESEADQVESITRGGREGKFQTRVRGGVVLRVGRPKSTTEAQRHGEHSRRVTEPRSSQTTQEVGESVKIRPVGSCIAKESEVGLNAPYLDAVRDPTEVSLGSPSVPRCLRGSNPQPSTLNSQRSEIELILEKQLGVEAAARCVEIALQTQTINQVAAVVEYAASQAVDGIQAWGPGFVFQRVSRPPSDAQGPQDGWAKPRPEWIVAKGRKAERERREREERRQNAERQLRQRRGEMEAFYGPVIDRLYREDKRHLWGLLTPAEQLQVQACGGSFTSRGAREIFLLAAIEGRFEDAQ